MSDRSGNNKHQIKIETNYQILVKCHICQSWTHHRVFMGDVFQFGLCDAHKGNSIVLASRIIKSLIQE